MTVLVLLAYYNRPKMVRYALESLRRSTHQDWYLAVCDDGSDLPAEPVVRQHLVGYESQISYYNSGMTLEQKRAENRIGIGQILNQALRELPADLVITLCDDDALVPNYMERLVEFYAQHPQVHYAHSLVVPYNPFSSPPPFEGPFNIRCELNSTTPCNPYCTKDGSQVSWRPSPGMGFSEGLVCAQDATLHAALMVKYGECQPTKIIGQFKGIHHTQLAQVGAFVPHQRDLP